MTKGSAARSAMFTRPALANRWPPHGNLEYTTCQWQDLKSLHGFFLAHEGNVQRPGENCIKTFLGRAMAKIKENIRLFPEESWDDRRQHLCERVRHTRHPQPSKLPCGSLVDRSPGLVHVVEDLTRFQQEDLTLAGQGRAPSGPVEQPDAQFFFQILDLRTQRRLSDVQAHRGPIEVQLLRHGDEVSDVPQLLGSTLSLEMTLGRG